VCDARIEQPACDQRIGAVDHGLSVKKSSCGIRATVGQPKDATRRAADQQPVVVVTSGSFVDAKSKSDRDSH